jgi:signal transduction histidine kinase
LAISDTGHGIDPEDLPRIFEPFYSTKGDGKGVGLGLSMVYGIIREHNGTIEVQSEPGEGTSFKMVLPTEPDEKTPE